MLNEVSSSYMEGRRRPVAIEVFDGNTADPMTLASQVDKLKQRFHLDHVVLVGDRGIITQARITEDIKSAGLHWPALRAPAIKGLLESGTLQLSLFDQRDIASISAPEFPNERGSENRRRCHRRTDDPSGDRRPVRGEGWVLTGFVATTRQSRQEP